ncbi:MAG: hypothetical protein AB7G87_01320 [Clostridia bacterium]
MNLLLKKVIRKSSGEGVLTTLIYLGVSAITGAAISYSIWASLAGQTEPVRQLIETTIR